MTGFTLRHLALFAITTLTMAGAAHAQYVWLDERGIKQFSDMPPPASVPANRILKQPRSAAVQTTTASDPTSQASTSKPALTTAEKNAEFRKRMSERADKEKKAEEETRVAADKTKRCDRARDYLRTLESGGRIAHMDKNGERAFLTDEQRAQERRDAERILADCK